MDILKCFKLNNEEYKVNIQGTHENPLFQANQIANIIGIKNISHTLSKFSDDEKDIVESYTLGGNQKTLFVTEIGLYRLLGRSNKPIANTFQKWMINIIKEIRLNGSYKLQETNEIDKKMIELQYALKNHKTFLQAYENKNVIYVSKLNEIENRFTIKIGSTNSIKDRLINISSVFNLNSVLLQVVEVDNYIKFERFLHNHEFIKKYYHPVEMKNKKVSKETYLVNQEELDEILKIIDLNKNKFKNNDLIIEEIKLKTEELKKVNESLSFEKELLSLEKEKIILKQKELEQELFNKTQEIVNNNLTMEDIIDDNITNCNYMIKERKNGKNTPKIYKYNPNDLKTPIKVYDSPIDVEREYENISLSQLKRSANNNTIYKDYRWLSLNRNDKLPESIPETKITKHKSPDIKYIAMIDIKQTKIMEVFANQKDAVEARNMKSKSFTRAIQNNSISSGHYWKFFDDCSEEMKKNFLLTSKLPEKYVSKISKHVEQIDPKTNLVIATYSTNREVCKKFQMSVLSLKKASDTQNIHHGYKWRIK